MPLLGSSLSAGTVTCNRCHRVLKAHSSVIRGIGPICARQVLKYFAQGLRGKKRREFLETSFVIDMNAAILRAYDKIVEVLQEVNCSLDVDHRGELESLLKNSSKVKVIEYVLVIFADICNQLCTATTIAVAVKHFFIALGLGDDEATKAQNRLIKIAKKVCTF